MRKGKTVFPEELLRGSTAGGKPFPKGNGGVRHDGSRIVPKQMYSGSYMNMRKWIIDVLDRESVRNETICCANECSVTLIRQLNEMSNR